MGLSTLLRVAGTGSYLPDRVVHSSEFEGRVVYYYDGNGARDPGKEPVTLTVQKILDNNGIQERRYASSHETLVFMAHHASVRALRDAELNADQLTGVIFNSVSQRSLPVGAAHLAHSLGIRPQVAYNIDAGCAGFPESLIQALGRAHVTPGPYLVVSSEVMSGMTDPDDINSTLFGDGAGAAVLVPSSEGKGILSSYSACDPHDGNLEAITFDGRFLRMPNGKRVFKQATTAMVEAAKRVKHQIGRDHADVYIPHQANERIVAKVEEGINDAGSVVYRTVSRFGNMGPATCAVALDSARREGVVKEGNLVVITGSGAGFYTAAVAVQF